MERLNFDIDNAVVRVVFTDATDGDFRVVDPVPDVQRRRDALNPAPWTSLRQVHGAEVVTVGAPGEHDLTEADGAVTFEPGCTIAVTTADCAPVVLVGSNGVAVVHAGWRGAADGVIEAACTALRAGGATPVATVVGPCIQPASYEFGEAELAELRERFGDAVEGRTTGGTSALDLHAVIAACCVDGGWPEPERSACTSGTSFFSHRCRGDQGRQATVAWIER